MFHSPPSHIAQYNHTLPWRHLPQSLMPRTRRITVMRSSHGPLLLLSREAIPLHWCHQFTLARHSPFPVLQWSVQVGARPSATPPTDGPQRASECTRRPLCLAHQLAPSEARRSLKEVSVLSDVHAGRQVIRHNNADILFTCSRDQTPSQNDAIRWLLHDTRGLSVALLHPVPHFPRRHPAWILSEDHRPLATLRTAL